MRWNDPTVAKRLADWWIDRLRTHVRAGVAGFRCEDPGMIPQDIWRHIILAVKQSDPHCHFLAWTPGLHWDTIAALRGLGFGAAFSSVPWWDGRASWFVEEHELLRGFGAVIGCAAALDGSGSTHGLEAGSERAFRHLLLRAAATSDGIMVPMGLEFGLRINFENPGIAGEKIPPEQSKSEYAAQVREALAWTDQLAGLSGELRGVAATEQPVAALLRSDASDARFSRSAAVVLINSDLQNERLPSISLNPLPPSAGMAGIAEDSISADRDVSAPLAPGEIRLVSVRPSVPIMLRPRATKAAKLVPSRRIVIANVVPSVDAGRFAAKRVIGETIDVEADVFTDGHEMLGVELLSRAADEKKWRWSEMQLLSNDRWRGEFRPDRIGRYQFTIEAWFDRYGTYCRELIVKHKAGADLRVEIMEGREFLKRAKDRAKGDGVKLIASALTSLVNASNDIAVGILVADDLREAMKEADERPFLCRQQPSFDIDVERPQAAFGTWYELFPRSATDDPARHGTLANVIDRLPRIRDMGFDALYFPPIHPIGDTNRKGKNNSLQATPDDVGSPYAIGSREGGHEAIHPALGTFDDFQRLRDAAAAHGMEIALDFAIQCSPDHPWLKEHPEWFTWRPDGTVRHAENPPKKYEDIVNPDFYAAEAFPALWIALRDIVLLWRKEGVRIFRVDNPHTKPLPFWKWLIDQVREKYPDVIFLSEAFTRPRMMYQLAKVGFSQSYTYFIWRNTKQELIEYFTELTRTAVKDYFRPHLFVNTPDINPYFLQTSGRPGFLVRAALAATLSGLWGMYSGFELCEAAALPGREEYRDLEKYQIKVRQFDAPGNISAEIASLNRIRKSNPALHTHLGLRFYPAHDEQVLLYGKMPADHSYMVLIAINLDPFHAHDLTIEVPVWEWKLPDSASVAVRDMMRDHNFAWHGKLQRIRLDPAELPFAIWRVTPNIEG